MKYQILIPFLLMSAGHSQVFSQELDFLDVFTDELTPTYDMKIDEVIYDKSQEVNGRRGSFSFSNFNVMNQSISTKLNNEDGLYNADIYVLNGRIGFVNNDFKFAYKLNPSDFEYLDSIRFAKISQTHFLMDREQILMDGHNVEFREPQTYVNAKMYRIECGRHPDYLLNDGNGFLAGCLNGGALIPKDDHGIPLEFKFFDKDTDEVKVELNSYINEAITTDDSLYFDALTLSTIFDGTTKLEAFDLKTDCKKTEGLISINAENVINPCLDDLVAQGSRLQVSMLEEGDFFKIEKPNLVMKDSSFNMKIDEFGYSSEVNTFLTGKAKMSCPVVEGDKVLIDSYMASCLRELSIEPVGSDTTRFEFNLDDKTPDEELSLNLIGEMQDLAIRDERLTMGTDIMSLNIDDELNIGFHDLSVDCQKDPEQIEMDIPAILDHCKKGLDADLSHVDFSYTNEKNKMIRGDIKPNLLRTENQKLYANIDSLKMVDDESKILIKDINGHCGLAEITDIFDVRDVINDCSDNMLINMASVYSDESNVTQKSLKSGSFDIDNVNVEEKKPGVSDIRIKTTNGVIAASLKVRVLGMNPTVTFSGKVEWNDDQSRLEVDVTHSRLPLGLKSKSLFISLAKKFLASEMIEFPKDNLIYINI